MLKNEQEFRESRKGFGQTDEQIEAELLVINYSPAPVRLLPSTSRSAYVSEEAFLHGLEEHKRVSAEYDAEDAKR